MKTEGCRILHAIFAFMIGGAETMLVDIANEQVARGCDVTLLIVNDCVSEQLIGKLDSRISVVRLGRREGANPLALLWRYNRCVARLKPDVLHVHNFKLSLLTLCRRRRMVWTVHCLDMPMASFNRPIIAAISEAVADDVRRRLRGADVTVIENGIDVRAIRQRRESVLHRPVRVVQVGRLEPSLKGQDILVEAAAILKRRGVDVRVSFIGGGDSSTLQQLADGLGVGDIIDFEGVRDRSYIYDHLADFDIMCHPSRFEGFGLTVAEGASAGLPLVVPDSGGPREVMDNGRLCTTFLSGSADACADALQEVIERYPEKLDLAERGRRYVCERFTVARMVDKYMKLYSRIAGGNHATED